LSSDEMNFIETSTHYKESVQSTKKYKNLTLAQYLNGFFFWYLIKNTPSDQNENTDLCKKGYKDVSRKIHPDICDHKVKNCNKTEFASFENGYEINQYLGLCDGGNNAILPTGDTNFLNWDVLKSE